MKRYLLVFVIMIVFGSILFGCVNNAPDVTLSSADIANSTDVNATNDSTEDSTEENTESPTINLAENAIWKKAKHELDITTVSFTKDWDKYIMVGEQMIASDRKTDVFELPNYFYLDGESYVDLETIYYVPTYRYNLHSVLTQFDTHVRGVLHVYSTSDIATHPHGAIIESIQYLSVVNPNEGGLISLLNIAKYEDGNFGFGSAKKDVEIALGNPTNSFIEEMASGVNLTTDIYVGEKTQLMLSYMWLKSDGENSAVLTTIKWDLTEIATYLHSQENVDKFEGRDVFISSDAQTQTE